MKQKSIYSLYGTKNKEQLYNKLKTNPEKVKELVGLMNYLKIDKTNERISINNPSQLGEIIERRNFENGKYIIGLDIQNKLIGEEKIENILYNKQIREIVEKSLKKDFKSIIIIETDKNILKNEIRNMDLFKKYNDLQTKLANFEINLVDSIVVTENYIYNKSEERLYDKTLQVSEKIEETYEKIERSENEEIYKIPKVEEFLNHYVNKEIKGLSIEKDKSKIEELLKVELSEKNIENFIVLKFDKNNKVIGKNNLTEGTLDKSSIYIRELAKDIINTPQIKGVIIAHNHPSGSTKPSLMDINITKKLKETLNSIDIKLYDHIIISREGKANLNVGLDEIEKKPKHRKMDFRNKRKEKELER